MISTFTAFIDSNVFYGARLRSLVLFVAQTKLFRARWTEQVHDEWTANLLNNRPDLNAEALAKTRALMNAAVPDCLVEGYEPLIEGIHLPDPDDRHIVAAAVMTRANVLVTFNQKDFPDETMEQFRLHVKHPDEFLLDALGVDPVLFLHAVQQDYRHYVAPPLSFEDYLKSLTKSGVPKLADALNEYKVLMEDVDDGEDLE